MVNVVLDFTIMNGANVKDNAEKYESKLSTKSIPTSNREAVVLDRLTKELNIRLDALKRSETITSEMLNRRVTI